MTDRNATASRFADDLHAPKNAARLFRLWESFGLSISLHAPSWDELRPVLDRMPALDLINPRLDRTLAEEVIARHLRSQGAQPRPVRWFPDARSARSYHSYVACLASPAFPSISGGASVFATAWYAGDDLCSANSERWSYERRRTQHELAQAGENAQVPDIKSLADLLELFAAGVFYYAILPDEVVCVARPSLWVTEGRLHRANGPAVDWPTGERYFFWHGVEVPQWVIENPQRITPDRVRAEPGVRIRHCMLERYGMERFPLLQQWAEWQKCHHFSDFGPFVASGIQNRFDAVSRRLVAHAEAAVARLMPNDFRKPQIDKPAVAAAMARFLYEWRLVMRPLRWFEDARSARAYLGQVTSELPRTAYWPRLRIAPVLDAVWYREAARRHVFTNVGWLQRLEDWQDWTIANPKAPDCNDATLITRRCERMEYWASAKSCAPRRQEPPSAADALQIASPSEPAVRRWTPLMDAFEAGLFAYWIGPREVVCIPRPALWFAQGQPHREDGPAVAWPTGERLCFWHGIEVPNWIIEEPEKITTGLIIRETNLERRRCMMERFGYARFLHESGAILIAQDQHGKLWHPRVDHAGRERRSVVLEVENGTREPDGTRRKYFLSVPPTMRTAREAVAWTYGLSGEQYDIAVRT